MHRGDLDDRLTTWLATMMIPWATKLPAKAVEFALDEIEKCLEAPPGARTELGMLSYTLEVCNAKITPLELARARDLYRRIFERGGTGRARAEKGILGLLGKTASSELIPFWVELAQMKRPKDTFASERRNIALSALALLAILRDEKAAYDALCSLCGFDVAEVRSQSVHFLAMAHCKANKKPSPDVVRLLNHVAEKDRIFDSRFLARDGLRALQLPVPLDNPDKVYSFAVKLRSSVDFECTIEIRSEQSLEYLHDAIQNAFDWDSEHIYEFFLNRKLYDHDFAVSCPSTQDGLRFADELSIGELGLSKGQIILYFFDYGDSHMFDVKVAGVREADKKEEYPRVAASKGKPPEQYPSW